MRHRLIRTAASAGLLAGALAASSCGSGAGAGAQPFGQAARSVPASSLAFVDVNLDRSSDGWRNLQALGRRIPGFGRMVSQLHADLAKHGSSGQSYDTSIAPWLGSEAGVAVTSIDLSSGQPQPVIEGYVAVRDEGALEHELASDHLSVKVGASNGYALYRQRTGGLFFGVGSGALLVASGRAALQQQIALRTGKGQTLATSTAYRQAIAALPGSRVITGFADPSQLGNLLGLATAFAPGGGTQSSMAKLRSELADITGVGFSASVDPAGFRLAGVVLVHGRAAQQMQATPGFEPALLAQVPASALAVADLHGSPATLRALQTTSGLSGLSGLPTVPGAPVPPQLRAATVAMRDALPVLTGEFAVDLLPSPGGDLLATPAKPAAAQAALGRLFATVARLIPHARVARVAGGEQLVLPPKLGAMSVGWRRAGGLFVAGTDPSTAKPAASLADSPAFTSLLHQAGVPTSVTGLLYVNIPGLAGLSGGSPADLRAFGGLVAWGQIGPGRVTGQIYVSVPQR